MKEGISRREFLKRAICFLLIGSGGIAIIEGSRKLAGSGQRENLLPEEKFHSILEFMGHSGIPEFAEIAQKYSDLGKSRFEKLVITNYFRFGQEPVDLQFYGGLEDGDSDWQIVVSEQALLNKKLTKENWSIYLFKTMLLFEIVDQVEGTAQEELDELANRQELEAKIWKKVWTTVDREFVQKISDQYLLNRWKEYQLSANP